MLIIYIFAILMASSLGKKMSAKTSEEFLSAIANSQPGDVIQLEPSEYEGSFLLSNKGTTGKPITILGKNDPIRNINTVIKNKDGPAFTLNGASYTKIAGLIIQDSKKGVLVQGSQFVQLESLIIENMDEEAILINNASDHVSIKSLIVQGATRGIIVGSPLNGDNLDRISNIKIHSTKLENIKEFPIRIFPGVTTGEIKSVIIDGMGMETKEDPFDSALVQMSGRDWMIFSNILNDAPLHGFSVKPVEAGGESWGCKLTFRTNICNLDSASGFCIFMDEKNPCKDITVDLTNIQNAGGHTSMGQSVTNVAKSPKFQSSLFPDYLKSFFEFENK